MTKSIILAASISTLIALSGVAHASDTSAPLTMKPLYGATFDVGSEHAVSYFTSENGTCKLVVTLAGEPNWDAPATFSAHRFEAAVQAGQSTRYISNTGKSIEFACHADALAMDVKQLAQFANAERH